MSLRDRIQDDMKTALRSQEKERLAALRLILAALKQQEIDRQITLDDSQVIDVLERMIKQRRESIAHYERANREDLAVKEAFEISIIKNYMPEPLGEAEIATLIDAAIAATGAQSRRDMSKVMGIVKSQAQGRADMAAISARVKAKLSG